VQLSTSGLQYGSWFAELMLGTIMVGTLTLRGLHPDFFLFEWIPVSCMCASFSYSAQAVIDLESIDVRPQVVALSFNYEL
jgi:hypothetical protein